jgi:hypothetical protein
MFQGLTETNTLAYCNEIKSNKGESFIAQVLGKRRGIVSIPGDNVIKLFTSVIYKFSY